MMPSHARRRPLRCRSNANPAYRTPSWIAHTTGQRSGWRWTRGQISLAARLRSGPVPDPDSSYPAAEEPAQPDDDSKDAGAAPGFRPPVMPAVGAISPQGSNAAGTGSPTRADQATAPVTGGTG